MFLPPAPNWDPVLSDVLKLLVLNVEDPVPEVHLPLGAVGAIKVPISNSGIGSHDVFVPELLKLFPMPFMYPFEVLLISF